MKKKSKLWWRRRRRNRCASSASFALDFPPSNFLFFILFSSIFFKMLLAAIDHHPNFSDPFLHLSFFFIYFFYFDPFFLCRIIIGGKCERAFKHARPFFFIHSSMTLLRLPRVTKKSVPPLLIIIISKEEFSNLKLCAVKPFLPDTAERLCRHSPSSSPDSLTWTNSFTSSRCKWCWLLFPQHPRKTFLFFSKGKVRKKSKW